MTRLRLIALASLCGALLPAAAQVPLPPPQNVLTLSATAATEVTKDLLSITLSATREGADAAAVQGQLKQALDAALGEARKVAKPGQLDVRTGAFSLYPRYSPKGGITGWQGTAEMVVDGRDTQAIAQLAGRVQTLTIARVVFSLSREAREKVEADIAAQAITRFRAQAEGYARQFGFAGFTVREVQVSSNDQSPIGMPMMRAQANSVAPDQALPIEAGKANVVATVSGSVVMVK